MLTLKHKSERESESVCVGERERERERELNSQSFVQSSITHHLVIFRLNYIINDAQLSHTLSFRATNFICNWKQKMF